MALLGAISKVSSSIGQGLQLIDSLFQNQITISAASGDDDTIFLNVVESSQLDFVVKITEKPVADLGAASDYISRQSTPLVLSGQISNRSLNLGADPVEFLLQHAASFVPEIGSVLNAAAGVAGTVASFAGDFFDLGRDEIDKKLSTLVKWQLNAEVVEVLGLRLDAAKITPLPESFNFLIESINSTHSKETGDNVDINITFKNLLNIQKVQIGNRRGGRFTDVLAGALNVSNPF